MRSLRAMPLKGRDCVYKTPTAESKGSLDPNLSSCEEKISRFREYLVYWPRPTFLRICCINCGIERTLNLPYEAGASRPRLRTDHSMIACQIRLAWHQTPQVLLAVIPRGNYLELERLSRGWTVSRFNLPDHML